MVPGVLWAVSNAGVSPAQRVADADPPPAPVVDVEVEERRLVDVAVVRAQVTAPEVRSVGAPALGDLSPVVIDVPVSVGDQVDAGSVLAVVADRPVIAVSMPVPLYRELTAGAEGPDVERWQHALNDMGYESPTDGRFDEATQAATRSFYEDSGFAPVTTSTGEGDQVWVPLGEVVGLGELPGVVSAVEAVQGTVAEGPLLSITAGDLVLTATVEPSLASLMTPGTSATAADEGWDLTVVSNHERDDQGRSIVRLEAHSSIPSEAFGRDVRVEVSLAATDTEVLAVPVAAVGSSADGAHVRVVDPDGEVRSVGITTGASIGGWVEIVDSDDDLTAGTVVRAG